MHTPPDTWATTSSNASAAPVPHPHEVSKPHVRVVSWSADRIGPTIIAAPHRGHVHVARVGGSVVVDPVESGAGVGGEGAASTVRARASRAVRRVFVRNPDVADAHEAARQNVLDKAAQKLHRRESHRSTLVAMGVVLLGEGDVVAIKGE